MLFLHDAYLNFPFSLASTSHTEILSP